MIVEITHQELQMVVCSNISSSSSSSKDVNQMFSKNSSKSIIAKEEEKEKITNKCSFIDCSNLLTFNNFDNTQTIHPNK